MRDNYCHILCTVVAWITCGGVPAYRAFSMLKVALTFINFTRGGDGLGTRLRVGIPMHSLIEDIANYDTCSFTGSLGIQGKDACGFLDTKVGAFDVSSGILTVLLVVLMILIMFLYTSHSIYSQHHCVLIMSFPVVVLALVCMLGIIANLFFSFISVVKVVYAGYNTWRPETINCTSPAFYSAFTYVTVEFTLILIFIVCLIIIITAWCCRRQCS